MQKSVSTDLNRDPLYSLDLKAAYTQAQQFGLTEADCEDCAAAFLMHKLIQGKDLNQDTALRYRCAHDFACDVNRVRIARSRHETLGADLVNQEGIVMDWPDDRANIEQNALRWAFWEALQPFFDQLQPLPRQVMQLHYRSGTTVAELAIKFGRTPHAIEQMLCRSRHRMLALLNKANIDATELFSYLVAPPPARMPLPRSSQGE